MSTFTLTVEAESFAAAQTKFLSLLGAPDGAKPATTTRKPAAEPGLDYEADVRPQVVALSKKHGREVALEVLGEFKNAADGGAPCTKGQEVHEKDWPKLLAAVAAKMEELDV